MKTKNKKVNQMSLEELYKKFHKLTESNQERSKYGEEVKIQFQRKGGK